MRDRSKIHTLPAIDIELAIVREADRVRTVSISEPCQSRPVEVDAVVLREIRVLASDAAASLKPDLTLRIINVVDVAHQPVAFRDLVLHLTRRTIVEVQMLPAVALRGPDDLLAIVHIMPIASSCRESRTKVAVVEEGIRRLGNERMRRARLGVHLDHRIALMAALVVIKCEAAAVLPPHRLGKVEWTWEEFVINLNRLLRGNVKEHRRCNVYRVTGLRVVHRRRLRLNLL